MRKYYGVPNADPWLISVMKYFIFRTIFGKEDDQVSLFARILCERIETTKPIILIANLKVRSSQTLRGLIQVINENKIWWCKLSEKFTNYLSTSLRNIRFVRSGTIDLGWFWCDSGFQSDSSGGETKSLIGNVFRFRYSLSVFIKIEKLRTLTGENNFNRIVRFKFSIW